MTALASSSLAPGAAVGRLRGFVEGFREHRVVGWCVDLDTPMRPVALEVLVGGHVVARIRTLIGRSDVESIVGAGTRAGFEFDLRDASGDAFRAGLLELEGQRDVQPLEVRVADGGPSLPSAEGLATRDALAGSLSARALRTERGVRERVEMNTMDSTKGAQGLGGFFGRFGAPKADAATKGVPRGCIDVFDGTALHGWAVAGVVASGSRRFALADGERIVAHFEANQFRKDLLEAGIGDGHHGFAVNLPSALFDDAEHALCIVSLADDAPIPRVEHRVTLPKSQRASVPAKGVEGNVDGVVGPFLVGWASAAGADADSITVEVVHRGVSVGAALANEYRADLAAAGKGGGFSGFRFALPAALASAPELELSVRVDGAPIAAPFRRAARRSPVTGVIDRVDHSTVVGALRAAVGAAATTLPSPVGLWCDDLRVATLEAPGPFRVELPAGAMDGREHRIALVTDDESILLDERVTVTNVVEGWTPSTAWFDVHALRTPVSAMPPHIVDLAKRIAESALFDEGAYAAAIGDHFASGVEAAVHYLRTRASWAVSTSPWVDVAFLSSVAELVEAGEVSPLEWYFAQSASADAGPNALFSNVDYAVLAGRSFDSPLASPSYFDEWLVAARKRPVAPSALVDAARVAGGGRASVADALAAWMALAPSDRRASALHAYFDDDWIGQRILLAQRKAPPCVFTGFRAGALRGIAPHAILDRDGADDVDFYAQLRGYELAFAERGVDLFPRVCPHFEAAAFRRVVAALPPSSAKKSSLAAYLAAAPSRTTPSFLSAVDAAFIDAQYPGLLAFCEGRGRAGDANIVAARWLRPLGLPTQLEHVTRPEPGMLGLQDLATLRSFRSAVPAKPRVSFVIPSYGRDDLVLRCILSAIQSPGAATVEFVVAEDAAHIDCGWILGFFLPFVAVRRNERNLGFLRSCNGAVPRTRGEIVLLVNNDVIVHRNAVNELLLAFDAFPRAGVVGGLILNRDGTIQENGGMLWRDASAWNYRRNHALDAESLFNTRAADYVSGCWIGIRRAVWDEVGGFDDRFAPAYYEESDLCMTVRQRGYDVLVAPHSVVTHLDGATMGQDENGNTLKAYQRINREKFLTKWRRTLTLHNVNGDVSPFHTGFDQGQKSLVIVFDHYVPEPDRDAGSRVMFAILRALAASSDNYVVFVPMNNHRERYAKALERMGIEVITGGEGWARFDALLAKHSGRVQHMLVSRLAVAEHFAWHTERTPCAKSIFLHDIEALRAFPVEAGAVHGEALVRASMERYVARYRSILARFDSIISLSEEETELLNAYASRPVVDIFPYNHEPAVAEEDVSGRNDILFVGSYNHPPNREAIEYFLAHVWPEVRDRLPGAKLHLCGSGFESSGMSCDARVVVHGQVTDATLSYLYRASRVAIAPLLSGAGVKGKVIEACAHGVLPVGTTVAWQGIDMPEECAFLSGALESFASRVVQAFEAFDAPAHARMIAFYEACRAKNNIDTVIPRLVAMGRRSR